MKKVLGVGLLLVFLFCAPSDATILSTYECKSLLYNPNLGGGL